MTQHLAVIGGGIGGLTAAHLLQRRYQVTLFERERRLGGNAYTLQTPEGWAIDIGVAAFGRAGYPRFYALLDELGIRPVLSPGSFISLHDLDAGEGVYLTPTLSGLRSVLRPTTLAALASLARGLARGRRQLEAGELRGLSMQTALERLELRGTARSLLLAVLCLLSSMSGEQVLAAPAEFFFGKLRAHSDVLSPRALYSVRCVEGGTRRYVDALARGLGARIVLGAALRRVRRDAGGVELCFDGGARRFDAVVFACNADQALGLLEAPTPRERALLGAWRYRDGRVVVHRDLEAMPARELLQAYTFLFRERDGRFETSVSGCTWRQPGVSAACDYVSTQHPNFPIRPERVLLDTVLRTPIFDDASCRTIPELPSLSGQERSYYCGSHFGYGLHEDAVASAQAVARALGVPGPQP
jgi:uncharacterized protein